LFEVITGRGTPAVSLGGGLLKVQSGSQEKRKKTKTEGNVTDNKVEE